MLARSVLSAVLFFCFVHSTVGVYLMYRSPIWPQMPTAFLEVPNAAPLPLPTGPRDEAAAAAPVVLPEELAGFLDPKEFALKFGRPRRTEGIAAVLAAAAPQQEFVDPIAAYNWNPADAGIAFGKRNAPAEKADKKDKSK
ncbi:hypothetical protein M3Y99_00242500 [Aphelenchoides fujianensis]|nr:hypothetical protein M3Y99_00242500 [Aphelenchoides fujianensis]